MIDITLHQMLEKIQKENTIQTYLEIGTREGCSLKNVVIGNSSLKEIFICDKWGRTYGGTGRRSHDHILGLLRTINYTGNAYFMDGDSKETIPILYNRYLNYFDLILVDGDHSYSGAMCDLNNVWPLCKNGGMLVFDDITHPGHMYLNECFDMFVQTKYSEVENIEKIYYGCGIGIIKKK